MLSVIYTASPETTWLKLSHKLGQLGYIETLQGKKGGIRLKRAANDITVGELIRVLEPMHLLDCSPEACSTSFACRLKQHLALATENFLKELDQYTIESLVQDNHELQQILFASQH